MGVVFVLLPILLIFVIAGSVGYWYYRRVLREAKNYERGLKMVPLLIHLPPASDDITSEGRDARDINEETIAKAQILYNVLASTATKGFKSNFYGQRHIAFEIIADKGVVNYYTAVPVAMVSVVQQAVTSAYPNAHLEEVEEHNLFSKVGRLAGTIGGEMVLKDAFVQPIATYQESKSDSMRSILNSLANLTKEDGAGIQILIRPAKAKWTKQSLAAASKIKKDKGKKSGVASLNLKGVGEALWKPPEVEEVKPEDKQLSNLEQAKVDAIEEKTRYPGYEVLVRVVASSNTAARSQAILANITASFSLFDSPGRNGFKFVPAKVIDTFVTAFIFRFFPPEINSNILNSVELATIFHFPDQKNTPTSQLQRQASKQVDGPALIPDDGLLIGYNVFRGVKKPIRMSEGDRRRHAYIIGQTGTGKSIFLRNLALQDMVSGRGFAFIDPHGDVTDELLGMVPKERAEDIIYFAPGEMDFPVGLNLFEYEMKEQQDFLIQESINMLYKLYDPQRQGIIGPRYEHLFRNAALTVMAGPEGGTFVDIPKLFSDKAYVNQKLKYVTDQPVLDFWLKEMPGSERSNEFGEVKSWFVSKFGAFLNNQMMRNIIGQTKSGFNIREVMDDGKILLVNLSKGKTGELNAKLLGMIFVMKFYAAAMGRANIPEDQRRDFTVYVDEFQNFSTETFSDILSEARKYRLSLIVANQFVGQLSEEIRDAVFGNVGTVISSRTGANDADFLVKYFSPTFDTEDLTKMPNYSWAVQMLINGTPTQPFSMDSTPPMGDPNHKLMEAVKRLSAAKYGRPKAIVEKAIFDRLKTIEPPKPAFGQGLPPGGAQLPSGSQGQLSGGRQGVAPYQQSPATKPGSSSFLDDWLAKRKQTMATKPNLQSVRPPALQAQPQSPQPPRPMAVQPQPVAAPPVVPQGSAISPEVTLRGNGGGATPAPAPNQQDATIDINNAIAGSDIASGEIAIDRQGFIHHPKDEEEAET
ncbi:ATP-binding protein [Candidatus Saccharibacteria bacterium]|nr:ATP-binding protein [Candidatus Saccharibacteria bacterium]